MIKTSPANSVAAFCDSCGTYLEKATHATPTTSVTMATRTCVSSLVFRATFTSPNWARAAKAVRAGNGTDCSNSIINKVVNCKYHPVVP